MKPDQLFCAIRKEWVAALPEELVRQYWIQQMIQELGYPAGGFALEKSLSQIPHLSSNGIKLPSRRADIIFFAKGIHPSYDLYPLILIECKAVKLTPKVVHQVVGYNFYLRAPFIGIVNQTESQTGWFDHDKKEFVFKNSLLPFQQIIKSCKLLA
ncbi:MAG: type I restriction enzyme HsdR N-terminal domain-containing protein [Parachlamydiaceae bacterium]|nr:type I restriction enzyme HsdR N-terminal domain-containing protein [Parachlamydiaceae bacterium]